MKKTGLYIVAVGVVIATIFSVSYYNQEKKIAHSKANHEIFLKNLEKLRSKTKKSEAYIAVENSNINKMKELLSGEGRNQHLTDLLSSRSILRSSQLSFKSELFNIISENIKEYSAKAKLYALQILPNLLPADKIGDKHQLLVSYLNSDDFNIEEKSMVMQGMHQWLELPQGAVDFLISLVKNSDQPRELTVALHNFSMIRKKQQLIEVHSFFDRKKDQWAEISLIRFLKMSLNKKELLNLNKDYFIAYALPKKNNSLAWDEFRLLYFQSFNIEKKYKNEILNIAKSNNNIWVKKQAQSLLEKIK